MPSLPLHLGKVPKKATRSADILLGRGKNALRSSWGVEQTRKSGVTFTSHEAEAALPSEKGCQKMKLDRLCPREGWVTCQSCLSSIHHQLSSLAGNTPGWEGAEELDVAEEEQAINPWNDPGRYGGFGASIGG